jgi:gluconate 2-dehydrogenase gamma chain
MITRLSRPNPPTPYRFFTTTEAALLIEICEQLIPRDDTPGATDTGAITYIDRQLSGFFARQQPIYRRGLEAFRQTCLQEHKLPFQELPPAKKIAALQALERGQVPKALWGDPTPQAFFNLVLAHTMQSFYGSPRHGGNRDYASYRMLGLDYPQFVGQNRYRTT